MRKIVKILLITLAMSVLFTACSGKKDWRENQIGSAEKALEAMFTPEKTDTLDEKNDTMVGSNIAINKKFTEHVAKKLKPFFTEDAYGRFAGYNPYIGLAIGLNKDGINTKVDNIILKPVAKEGKGFKDFEFYAFEVFLIFEKDNKEIGKQKVDGSIRLKKSDGLVDDFILNTPVKLP